MAIAGLRDLANQGSLNCELILKYLQSEPDLLANPASFVGLVCEPAGILQFGFNVEKFRSNSLGNVFSSGSGSIAIHEFSDFLKDIESKTTGLINAANTCIAKTMILGGLLLQAEFRGGKSAATLRNMFGGGYEIAFFSNGQLQKLKEVTYIFWEAEITPTDVGLTQKKF